MASSKVYVDGSPFDLLFASRERVKLLSVFVAERGRDLSKSEVARQAGVACSTVYDHLDDLEALGVIKHTRDTQAGHSERYQLNDDSAIAEHLYKLEGVTLRRLLEMDGVNGDE